MDRIVSLDLNICCLFALSAWAADVAVVIVDAFTSRDLDSLTIVLACTAALFQMRGQVSRLLDREQRAFELGRDCERGEQRLTSLRSAPTGRD